MPVNLPLPDAATLFPIAGVRIGVAEAGVRKVGDVQVRTFCGTGTSAVKGGTVDHLGAGSAVRLVIDARPHACAGLHQHAVEIGRAHV